MNKKQTAIEWLDNELCSLLLFEDMEAVRNHEKLIKQAKAMEKQQIETAFEKGFSDGSQDFKNDMDYINDYADDFGKQYYNKTYEN